MGNGVNDFSSAWTLLKKLAAENSNGEFNKKNITNEQVQSIMLGADTDDDGVVSESEFRTAFFSSEAYSDLEQEYLDAFDMVSGADGVHGTLSEQDMSNEMVANNGGVNKGSDEGTMSERAGGGNNGGGSNGGGPGGSNPAGTTAASMPERKTASDLLAGNPDKQTLVNGQADALAAIDAERTAHEQAVSEYEGQVAAQQEAWDKQTDAFNEVLENAELTKEATIEAREGVDAANEKREAVDAQVSEQSSAVDTAKAKVSALKGAEPDPYIEVVVGENEDGSPITESQPNPEHATWVAELADAEAEVTEAEETLESLKEDQAEAEEAYNKAVENFMTVAEQEKELPQEIADAKAELDTAKDAYNEVKTDKPPEITQHKQKMDILQANANAYRDAVMTLETNIPEGYKMENGKIVEDLPEGSDKVPHTLEESEKENFPANAEFPADGTSGAIIDKETGEIIGQVTVDSEGNATYFEMGLQEPEPLTYSSKYDMAAALFEGGIDEKGNPIPAEDMWTNGKIDFTNMSSEDVAEIAEIYDNMVAEYNEGKPENECKPDFRTSATIAANNIVANLGDNPKAKDIEDAKGDIVNITAALVGIGDDMRSQLADLDPNSQEYKDIKGELVATITVMDAVVNQYENILAKEGVSTNPDDENYNAEEAEKLAALEDAINGLGAEIKQNTPAASTESFNAFLENNGIDASKTSPEMLSIYAEQFMAEVNGTEIVLDDAQITTVVNELMGDENFNGEKSNANAAWDRHDFSNYSPETMAKIMSAYDEKAGENGRSFLESADFYGIDEAQKSNIADSVVRATGLDGELGEYAKGQVEAAITAELESGDSTFIQAIIKAPNEALEFAQGLIKDMDLINQVKNSEALKKDGDASGKTLADRLAESLEETAAKDYISPEALELAKTLTTDEAWDNINFAEMSDAEIAQLAKAYDSINNAGAFDAAYAEKFPANEDDKLMEAIDTQDPSAIEDADGKKQDIADALKAGEGWDDLTGMTDQEIAEIAHLYEGGPDAFLQDYQDMLGDLETSEYTTIRQGLTAGRADAEEAKANEAAAEISNEELQNSMDLINGYLNDIAAFEANGLDVSSKVEQLEQEIGKILSSENIPYEQKLKALESLNTNEATSKYVQGYLNNSESGAGTEVSNIILDAVSDPDTTPQDLIALDTRIKDLTGMSLNEYIMSMDNQELSYNYMDGIINMYGKSDANGVEALNTTFDPINTMREMFPEAESWWQSISGTHQIDNVSQTNLLTKLLNNIEEATIGTSEGNNTDAMLENFANKSGYDSELYNEMVDTAITQNNYNTADSKTLKAILDNDKLTPEMKKGIIYKLFDGDTSKISSTLNQFTYKNNEEEVYTQKYLELFN